MARFSKYEAVHRTNIGSVWEQQFQTEKSQDGIQRKIAGPDIEQGAKWSQKKNAAKVATSVLLKANFRDPTLKSD